MNKWVKVVLTGGPCGGKTTALSYLREHFMALGYQVVLLPELASFFSSAGIPIPAHNPALLDHFETELFLAQIALEDSMDRMLATSEKPVLMLLDRGCMDVKAYVSPECWAKIVAENGESEVQLRDFRYNAVLHLTTAAIGAAAFYSSEGNRHRYENPEQAAALDKRLLAAWIGHPHLRVIDNRSDFKSKMERVVRLVAECLGIPHPVEYERKFLVESFHFPADCDHTALDIVQDYLLDQEGVEARVRRRGQDGRYLYFHTLKTPNPDGSRTEIERLISDREYESLLRFRDPLRNTIHKTRYCFVYQSHYMELDVFHETLDGMRMLEVELSNHTESYALPPFIQVGKEVTEDLNYRNARLAMARSMG